MPLIPRVRGEAPVLFCHQAQRLNGTPPVSLKVKNKYSLKPHWKQRLFFASVILISFAQWVFPGGDSDTGTGSPLANGIWAVAYSIGFFGVIADKDAAIKLIRESLPLVAIMLLASLSTFWSDQPLVTARRSIELIGTVALTLHLVRRLGIRWFIETLGMTIFLAALISLILVILLPQFGTSSEYDGAWNGFFNHKNSLGTAMVLGMFTIACTVDRSRGVGKWFRIAAICTCLLLLIGSRNASSYGSAIALALILPLLILSRAARFRAMAVVYLVVILGGLLALSSFGFGVDNALGVVGKDSTLTGRGDVWQLVFDAIGHRPFLGYGYVAFWGWEGSAATLIYPYINWTPGTAHNGFLETALYLGITGEIALFVLIIVGLSRAFMMCWQGADLLSVWPLATLLWVIVGNVSEATFIMYNEVDWIVFVGAFFFATDSHLYRPLQRQQRQVAGEL